MSSPHDDAAPLRTSPLHDRHVALGAKFAEFGGWSMPLEYAGSGVIKEHTAVREAVGIFDVSHLGKALVHGPGAADYVNATLSNDLGEDRAGQGAVHAVLRRRDRRHRRRPDRLPARRRPGLPGAERREHRRGAAPAAGRGAGRGRGRRPPHATHAVLAVQGPLSDEVLDGRRAARPATSTCRSSRPSTTAPPVVVCRTGYTGERGYELVCENDAAPALWDALVAAGEPRGLLPCGLGARDTLRTEMGYPLHGQDISLDVTPNQARLGWAVGWKKPAFWGRDVLVAEKEQGAARLLRGLVATGRGIPRPGMRVLLAADVPVGAVTSGHLLADPAHRASASR